MVISDTVARFSIIVGVIELIEAGICAIISIVLLGVLSGGGASGGFWTLVFIIPGILMITGGKNRNTCTLGVALGFNIVATIVSSLAFAGYIIIWVKVEDECSGNRLNRPSTDIDCSQQAKIVGLVAALAIVMFILAVTSLIGCILGCMGTCCAPTDTVVIRANTHPSTIVVSSSHSNQHPALYNQQMASRNPYLSASAQNYNVPASAPSAYGIQNTHAMQGETKY